MKLNRTLQRHLQTGEVPRAKFFSFCLANGGIIGFYQRKSRDNSEDFSVKLFRRHLKIQVPPQTNRR